MTAGTQRDDASDRALGKGHRASSKGGFRPDVEGLRAVAVVAVLLYHASVPFAPGGYVGVDVFFVISGFLITGLIVADESYFDTRRTAPGWRASFYKVE